MRGGKAELKKAWLRKQSTSRKRYFELRDQLQQMRGRGLRRKPSDGQSCFGRASITGKQITEEGSNEPNNAA